MKLRSINILQLLAFFFFVALFYIPILFFFSGNNPLYPEKSFFNFSFFLNFFKDPWNLRVIVFSVFQAFLSAILSILFALPSAWLLVHYDFPAKRWFRIFTYLPFILPSILIVLAMVQFFGNNGWINRLLIFLFGFDGTPVNFLYSFSGILIAHVFYNFPIAMKIVADQWNSVSIKYTHGAISLGAGSIKIFFFITLPLIMPSLGSAFLIIFLLCMNSFAIILVLGGGISYTTIEVLIYQLARIELDYSGASSLAFIQCLLSLICMIFIVFGSRINNLEQSNTFKLSLINGIKEYCPRAWFSLFWIFFVLIFALGPLFTIFFDSFRKFEKGEWVYTLYWYKKLFDGGENNYFLLSFWNSLRIALGSAILSSFMGIGLLSLIVYKKGIRRYFWEAFSFFPIVLSSVVFGVAWFHFFQRYFADVFSLVYVVIAMHAILTCPFWISIVLPSLENIPSQWVMESKMLGKKPLQYGFKILLPWLKKTFIIAFFLSFSLSIGELNSTMMIADESVRTLPIEMYDAISGYRFSYASVIAVMILFLYVTTYLFVELSLGYFSNSR